MYDKSKMNQVGHVGVYKLWYYSYKLQVIVLEIVVWICDIIDNNLEMKISFTNFWSRALSWKKILKLSGCLSLWVKI